MSISRPSPLQPRADTEVIVGCLKLSAMMSVGVIYATDHRTKFGLIVTPMSYSSVIVRSKALGRFGVSPARFSLSYGREVAVTWAGR